MSASDGRIIGTRKIVDHGSEAERWDLVILGDGYAEHEVHKFEQDVDGVVNAIFSSAPLDEFRTAINVHRVTVISKETGASNLCDGTRRATFFDSTHCAFEIDRLLVANETLALTAAINQVPAMNAVLMIVNSAIYGGSGGAVSVVSTAAHALEVALHEMGHSHFGLADEYPARVSCQEPGHDRYAVAEPAEPNVSMHADGRKWQTLLTPGVALPTMANPDCMDCDRRPSAVPQGTVGTFEGARYYRCGLYRPAYDCRMNHLGVSFCAVCQETIRRVLAPFRPRPGRRRAVSR